MTSDNIIEYAGITPVIDASVYIAGGAVVLGDVHIGADS